MDSPAQARIVLGPLAKVIRGELVLCQVEDWVALTILLRTVAVLKLNMSRSEKNLTHMKLLDVRTGLGTSAPQKCPIKGEKGE